MRRIFAAHTYSDAPRAGCWWDKTCDLPECAPLESDRRTDVAIVGAGFTGLNAALTLAEAGLDVTVLDARAPGWGASGRNGGFCCLGGGKASDAMLDRQLGKTARLEWRKAEAAAVAHVGGLLDRFGIDADRHSIGETLLAHRPMALEAEARAAEENYGARADVLGRGDLPGFGLGDRFHGAVNTPLGFALNPRKYLAGLLSACLAAGVQVHGATPVTAIGPPLATPTGRVSAERVLIATNGYSSEDLPQWLAGRYMPVQSSVLVTRPLSPQEQERQGWTSLQMCFDTRHLLHYFRLMPDGRFLFGRRGGLGDTPASEARAVAALKRDFAAMFPAWADVPLEGHWSGMVCLARHLVPYAGDVPGHPGLSAALCYHGNGVAMGSYLGHVTARAMLGDDIRPEAITRPLARFPLGSHRRAIMWPIYAGLTLRDALPF